MLAQQPAALPLLLAGAAAMVAALFLTRWITALTRAAAAMIVLACVMLWACAVRMMERPAPAKETEDEVCSPSTHVRAVAHVGASVFARWSQDCSGRCRLFTGGVVERSRGTTAVD
jgi:Na+/melibiose symporter-like transporter